jgi:hypothetical protein
MKCPECGAEMEKGVVSGAGFGLAWSEGTILSLWNGEPLSSKRKNHLELHHMDGFRCTKCKLVLAYYDQ